MDEKIIEGLKEFKNEGARMLKKMRKVESLMNKI